MASTLKEQDPSSEKPERLVNESVKETFSASDPAATGGITGIETDTDSAPADTFSSGK
jgi:hypothetical protein